MTVRIGCLGGGQLGRMLALAGYPLGVRTSFVDPQPDCSAGQVGELLLGAYDDPRQLDQLASDCQLATFEFESVPDAAAARLGQRIPLFPSVDALRVGQDRLREKQLFAELSIPTARFVAIDQEAELAPALERLGAPARLKARRLGYDGHGQAVVRAREDLAGAWSQVGGVPSLLEEAVDFSREVSMVGVRRRGGETAFYPLVENHHENGVLRLTLAPAPDCPPALQLQAERLCALILERLDYVGVLAVELFQKGDRLLANEIAPRVHNSGHWTIEGCPASQFENHLRAGLDWPLGSTRAQGYCGMVNLLGEQPSPAALLAAEGAHLHLYGKQPRPGRKLGHVTVFGPDPLSVSASLRAVAQTIGVELPAIQAGSYWAR